MIFNEHQIPLFYHPTNVLMLDDDISMLNNLSLKIDDNFPYVLKDKPSEALAYLKSHCFDIKDLSSLIINENTEQPISAEGTETYDINFSKLQSNLKKPDRFKKVVTLIVDYHMPQMTGHDFCKLVRDANLPCKIILLTGMASLTQAIDAFNAGVIDAYISKDENDIYAKLNYYLQSFALETFQYLSSDLSGILAHKFKLLHDKQFKQTFSDIIKQHNIVEYYILNSNCDFLMFDENGNSKILTTISDEDFKDIYDIAQDNGASQKVLQALKDRQKFPFLSHEHPARLHFQDSMWEDYLVPVNKINGRHYYYMLVDKSINVTSFASYVGSVWPEP